jgi:hypothetical protein
MTAQPLALRYVTSWTFQASAAALRRTSARYLAGLAATPHLRWHLNTAVLRGTLQSRPTSSRPLDEMPKLRANNQALTSL